MIQDDVLCASPEPVKLCFQLSNKLRQLANRQQERRAFYDALQQR
jgi:hypothetical protein